MLLVIQEPKGSSKVTFFLDHFVYELRKHSTNHILDKLTLYTFENGLLTWYFAADLSPLFLMQ